MRPIYSLILFLAACQSGSVNIDDCGPCPDSTSPETGDTDTETPDTDDPCCEDTGSEDTGSEDTGTTCCDDTGTTDTGTTDTGTTDTGGLPDVDDDSDGFSEDDGDCDDTDASVNPGEAEVPYDGVDNDCDAGTPDNDLDGDGYDYPEDCNDSNMALNPLATDLVGDGVDQNCDGVDGTDGDGDGYASEITGGDDCDDTLDSIYPGAPELWYDGIDQSCVGIDWGGDNDQDGDGDDWDGMGGDDCDDTDAGIYVGAPEDNTNGTDDNCNGITDGLSATLSWDPSATGTDIAFSFTMFDDPTGSRLSLYTNDRHEVYHFCDGSDCEDDDGFVTTTEAYIDLQADHTDHEGDPTAVTYKYTSASVGAASVGGCLTWGPESALLASTFGCIEDDPTTW